MEEFIAKLLSGLELIPFRVFRVFRGQLFRVGFSPWWGAAQISPSRYRTAEPVAGKAGRVVHEKHEIHEQYNI
jgi:hypothetical protein